MSPSESDSLSVRMRYFVPHIALGAMALWALSRYHQEFLLDDGAFYLRYAEHIASGVGYRWNPGEQAPIGASVPLWPLFEAGVMLFGASGNIASQVLAFLGLFVSSVLLTTTFRHIAGWPGAITIGALLASTAFVLGSSMGGMETPLTIMMLSVTFAKLAAGFDVDSNFDHCVLAMLAAGLCIIKLDLAPWAVGALIAVRFDPRRRQAWLSVVLLIAMPLAFFAFMKISTGSALPISFLRKLQDSAGIVSNVKTLPRAWFGSFVFLLFGRGGVTALALLAASGWLRARPRLLVFLTVGILGQFVAYTIFPPTEPFIWYLAPSLFAMDILAAGVFLTVGSDRRLQAAAAILVLTCGGYGFLQAEHWRSVFVTNAAYTEADRSRAGQWVAAHTPKSYRVLTGWGNPAYYAQRRTYDSSGLNYPVDTRLTFDQLAANYAPEILIFCPWKTGVGPKDYKAIPPGYRVVKSFSSAQESGTNDFFALVLARDDVADALE